MKKRIKINYEKIKPKINKEKVKEKAKEIKSKAIDVKDKAKDTLKINKTSKTCWIFLFSILIIVFLLSFIFFGLLFAIGFSLIYIILALLTLVLDNNEERSVKRKIVKFILTIGLVGCIIAAMAFIVFFIFIAVTAPKFDVDKLKRGETTLIYDKDDNLIATLGTEKREKISYEEIPEVLVDAIIATEDSRFFQHNGFDAPRFLKASVGQALRRGDAGGGSTLTMQVAKNNFTSVNASGIKGIIRKFTDIYLSIFKIEKSFTKEEIIEFYVNAPYLGANSYGVEQASKTYFNKHASELNLAEASLIAGLFQAPGAYDPYIDIEAAAERRSTVLSLMVKHGYITKEEKETAESISIESLLKNTTYVTTNKYQGYLDQVVKEVVDKTGYDPYMVPMKIYTNMDTGKQEAIEKVFTGETFAWANDTIQGGSVAIESATGKIVAIGAGRNRSGERTFSYATDISRQVGSTAKPLFDYAPGIEFNNWSTGKIFNDVPWSYSGSSSKIVNYDGAYRGIMTMRYALADSRNVPAVQAFQQVEKSKIIDFVTTLGIKPELCESGYTYNTVSKKCVSDTSNKTMAATLHEAHSLGAFNGASPLQMAGAYAAFSNGGSYHEPYAVRKIEIRETEEVTEYQSEKVKAMSDATAYMITDILKEVARTIGANGTTSDQVAAKTGTTNYDSETRQTYGYPSSAAPDGWIVGFTPNMVVAIWTGYTENIPGVYITQSNMVNQRNGLFRACASAAFNSTGAAFTKPSSVVAVTLERGTELLASDSTPANLRVTELFKRGTEPKETSKSYVSLPNVTGLSVTYKDGKSKISWNSVNEPSDSTTAGLGKFGYRVYLNGTELGFTTNNYYNYVTTSPYGEYTVKTSYSDSYNKISGGVSYTLQSKIDFNFNIYTSEELAIGDTYQSEINSITVTEDGIDVTSFAAISEEITDLSTNSIVSSIDTSYANNYSIKYTATYKGETKEFTKSLIVK